MNSIITLKIEVVAWVWTSGDKPQLDGGTINGEEKSSSEIRDYLVAHWGKSALLDMRHMGDEDHYIYSVVVG